jgi:multidrug efflux pump subunit AcrA (membrane-fusion protein)
MRPPSVSRSGGAFWRVAVLGFVVLPVANIVLVGYAWLTFVRFHSDFFDRAWPTFSRVLTSGDLTVYKWLAAVGGAGLAFGAAAAAVMRWQQMREFPECRRLLATLAASAVIAALMGVVHYFHVVVNLLVSGSVHMLLSYIFFFGMTLAITVDTFCSGAMRRMHAGPDIPCTSRVHRRLGISVLACGVVFLATYLLKDVAGNPWRAQTQKVFVCAEVAWAVLAQAYAIFYIAPVREHFRLMSARSAREMRGLAARASLFALALIVPWTGPYADARAASPGTGIGGTGRIQPSGGVIAVSGPPGRFVERVAVREGERVRKGALLLVSSDEGARALERDVAAERLRNAERQSVERRKIAELEVELARVALALAQSEASALTALDERTVPGRERQQRAHAVNHAQVALQLANARHEEVRKSSEAELRIATMNLKLAESALAATRVFAPVDATVLEVHVQSGSSAGGTAIVLANTSNMYVVGDFFEGDLPRLSPGQRVKVSNAALGQTLDGAIERVGRVVDPVNRLAKVWVKLDRPSPADRFIGMQVDLKVDAERVATTKPAPR